MEKETFESRRHTDPQGLIDDLVKETTRQAKSIHELKLEIDRLKEDLKDFDTPPVRARLFKN